jgi:prepilin-type processing-associated H-X9-DG protein
MNPRNRRSFTLFQLLIILALLAILFALFLPYLTKVRFAAARSASANNLRQIGIAMFNYLDTNNGSFPPGNDDNNFSAAARILPYIEQNNLFNTIDFKKPMDDKANAAARKAVVKTFLSPLDRSESVSTDYGPTNYLFNAGSKASLTDNDGVCYQNSKIGILEITDGTSNTLMAVETLKGDGGIKAMDMRRQHILLKKEDLKNLQNDAGVKDWEKDKNVAGDRAASWMDGRFLQGTFTGTRTFNDGKPDVSCAGFGGLSGPRGVDDKINALFCDGSVRAINSTVKLEVWKLLAGRNDGQPLPPF